MRETLQTLHLNELLALRSHWGCLGSLGKGEAQIKQIKQQYMVAYTLNH